MRLKDMKYVWLGLLPLSALLALQAGMATALSCRFPEQLVAPYDEERFSEDDIRRHRSKVIFESLRTRDGASILVFGQFAKNDGAPFLHEEQIEEIRGLFWPPSENIQMPYQIEYSYLDAFRFDGQQILNGKLVPLVLESIDARISISAEYEGIVDALPDTGMDVIGVLRPVLEGKRLEITASPCPTYQPVEASQVTDLLVCINEGECR
ncbi:MAG: hypothetical protein ABJ251_10140 [Paracoccaceae bacterium]